MLISRAPLLYSTYLDEFSEKDMGYTHVFKQEEDTSYLINWEYIPIFAVTSKGHLYDLRKPDEDILIGKFLLLGHEDEDKWEYHPIENSTINVTTDCANNDLFKVEFELFKLLAAHIAFAESEISNIPLNDLSSHDFSRNPSLTHGAGQTLIITKINNKEVKL